LSITLDCCAARFVTRGTANFFAVDAIVILPDHLHAILTLPPVTRIFPAGGRRSKLRSREELSQQGRPFPAMIMADICFGRDVSGNTIRDDQDFERCTNYIHFNPVKHRLVSRPGEWPFSSLHRYVRAGMLPRDWSGDQRANYGNFGERGK
jgi:putative transposase